MGTSKEKSRLLCRQPATWIVAGSLLIVSVVFRNMGVVLFGLTGAVGIVIWAMVHDMRLLNREGRLRKDSSESLKRKIAESMKEGGLDAGLRAAGLHHYAAVIKDLAKPGVRLIATKESVDGTASRFGGTPAVPAKFRWPLNESGNPLSFLCQINLQELSSSTKDHQLPCSGLLSFFYDCAEQPWGFDPKHKTGWRVLYFPSLDGLSAEQNSRTDESLVLPTRGLRFSPILTFPDSAATEFERIGLPKDLSEAYSDFCDAMGGRVGGALPVHQMFGYPCLIQNDWKEECQLASNGIYVGDEKYLQVPEAQKLLPGKADWELLLQIDTDDDLDAMWGDGGIIYFAISRSAMAECRFDDAWFVLQCF